MENSNSPKERIVVVGANSAGVTAAAEARKRNRDVEIFLISEEGYPPYSRCGLPYVLSGEVPSFKELLLFHPSFFETMKIKLRLESEVVDIDPKEKTVKIEQGGERDTLSYTTLILATGAKPRIPSIPGIENRGVFFLRTLEDGRRIQEALREASSAVVIGAGFIGLELAHALVKRGIEVRVIEQTHQVLPKIFDRDMAEIVQRRIEEKEVQFLLGKTVDKILGDGQVTGVITGEEQIGADIVLIAVGAAPNIELATRAGLHLGATGGIKVNPRMETSNPEIYAAGDCVESTNLVTSQPAYSPLGTTASRQGKVAGANAAGGYSIFQGVLDSMVSAMFNFEIGGTGITEAQAENQGFETVSGSITSQTRAEYYPGGKEIVVKIVAEPEVGRVIGGQIIGGEEVTQRVNLISIAIQNRMSVWELSKADTCYAPSVCTPWEPVILAAETTRRQLEKR